MLNYRLINRIFFTTLARNVHSTMKILLPKYQQISRGTKLVSTIPITVPVMDVLDKMMDEEDEKRDAQEKVDIAVEEACNKSMVSMLEFLSTIVDAINHSTAKYMREMKKLRSHLEEYKNSKDNQDKLEVCEDNIIITRAKLYDHEQKYNEMVSILENVEKVIKAISEVSYSIEENSEVWAKIECVHFYLAEIKLNVNNTKDFRKELFLYENSVNSEFNDSEMLNAEKKNGNSDS